MSIKHYSYLVRTLKTTHGRDYIPKICLLQNFKPRYRPQNLSKSGITKILYFLTSNYRKNAWRFADQCLMPCRYGYFFTKSKPNGLGRNLISHRNVHRQFLLIIGIKRCVFKTSRYRALCKSVRHIKRKKGLQNTHGQEKQKRPMCCPFSHSG